MQLNLNLETTARLTHRETLPDGKLVPYAAVGYICPECGETQTWQGRKADLTPEEQAVYKTVRDRM